MKLNKFIKKYMFLLVLFLFILMIIYLYLVKKKRSIIIVGKAPNVETFIKNKDKYKNFDKMAINSAVYFDIDFKYYIQQDFLKVSNNEFKKRKYFKNLNNYTAIDTILYAKKNKVNVILGFHVPNPNKIPERFQGRSFNTFPKELKKMNKFWEEFYFNDVSNEFKITYKNNKKIYEFQQANGGSGTVLWTAVLCAIDKGYTNIYLSGITDLQFIGLKDKNTEFFYNIKKTYPNINIYCLYTDVDADKVFNCKLITN